MRETEDILAIVRFLDKDGHELTYQYSRGLPASIHVPKNAAKIKIEWFKRIPGRHMPIE